MNSLAPEVLENITTKLVRRGLPIDYAQRAATELADHHRDLIAELCGSGLDETTADAEASRRLGDSRTLTKNIVREYQRRYWCGRWPLVTFLFGPLVMVAIAWLCTFMVFLLIGYALEMAGFRGLASDGILSRGEYVGMWSIVGWLIFVVPAGVLIALSKCAARAALDWKWVALAAMVLAVNIGTMQCGYTGVLQGTEFRDAATGLPLPPDRFVMSSPMWIFFSSLSDTTAWFDGRPQRFFQLLLPLVVAAMVTVRSQFLKHRWRQDMGTAC